MIRHLFRWVTGFSIAALAMAAEPALSPDAALLERAGARVQQFWDEISSVACTENVVQEKLNDKGKVVLRTGGNYDYLVSLRWNGGELLADESRLEVGAPQKRRPEGSLLATRGFATMLLVFHPEYQPSYHFELLPEERDAAGRALAHVSFAARNQGRSPAALELKGREYPITWEGTAWIDPASATVVRIEARWKEPPAEVGIESLSSDVTYAPFPIRGEQVYWLPATARIELKTPHQSWRNVHQFTKYRLFSVDAETKVGGAK